MLPTEREREQQKHPGSKGTIKIAGQTINHNNSNINRDEEQQQNQEDAK